MTYAEFKTLVKEALEPDGDTNVTINVTFNSAWCKRVQRYLQKYVRETYHEYTPRIQATWATQALTLNMRGAPADGTTPVIFEPTRVWFGTTEISRVSVPSLIELYPDYATATAGVPDCWANWRGHSILFNKTLSAAAVSGGVYVAGWATQPNFNGDADSVKLWEDEAEIAAEFCAIEFMRPTVADQVGLQRLKMYEERTRVEMARYKSRNLADHYGWSIQRGRGVV